MSGRNTSWGNEEEATDSSTLINQVCNFLRIFFFQNNSDKKQGKQSPRNRNDFFLENTCSIPKLTDSFRDTCWKGPVNIPLRYVIKTWKSYPGSTKGQQNRLFRKYQAFVCLCIHFWNLNLTNRPVRLFYIGVCWSLIGFSILHFVSLPIWVIVFLSYQKFCLLCAIFS